MNSMTHFKISLFTPLRWIRGFGWAFFRSMRLEVIDYSHQSVTEFCYSPKDTAWGGQDYLVSLNIKQGWIDKVGFMFSTMYQSAKSTTTTCICWSSHEMVTSVKSWSSTRHFSVKLAALSNSFQHKLNFWVSMSSFLLFCCGVGLLRQLPSAKLVWVSKASLHTLLGNQ